MIVLRYSEVEQDSAVDARSRERELLDRSILLFEKAQAEGSGSMAEIEAVHFAGRFWSIVLEDLASEDNTLTKDLRAGIISVGIWILQECEAVRQGDSGKIEGIIGVSQIIKGGL
ncbi:MULTISPECIES: flagellar biosynthesis regulator FlaF [Ahrensia]|uniref:flagellar biosynthesis regulator FlaF n=1 Tax=Ahrensia TaxID=152180 RepID=UPI0003826E7A|nr:MULTISPECIES: flagellar biosynthesis regulator FlaF [Ahrensia]